MKVSPDLEAGDQLPPRVWRDILVRKIDVRFHVRQRRHQLIAQFVDALRQFPGQLFVGRLQCELGPGVNQVRHCLRLRQVDAPIQKRAPGEFSRRRQPGATRPAPHPEPVWPGAILHGR